MTIPLRYKKQANKRATALGKGRANKSRANAQNGLLRVHGEREDNSAARASLVHVWWRNEEAS